MKTLIDPAKYEDGTFFIKFHRDLILKAVEEYINEHILKSSVHVKSIASENFDLTHEVRCVLQMDRLAGVTNEKD